MQNIGDQITALFGKLQDLEAELEGDLEAQRKEFHYAVKARRVKFDAMVLQYHKSFRTSVRQLLTDSSLPSILASPFVYLVIFPLLILDLMLWIFQLFCAPVYGIAKVRRADYVVLDRHMLSYLNPIEKINCVYCGYANGLLGYAREIAGRAEAHWCPIKHAIKVKGAHPRYYQFADYGDAKGFRENHDARHDTSKPD